MAVRVVAVFATALAAVDIGVEAMVGMSVSM